MKLELSTQHYLNFCNKIAINEETGCWEWLGCLNSRSYGCIRINKKTYLTHRVSYEFHKGSISAELVIDHLCRNRSCCNPVHLEAVSSETNSRRGQMVGETHMNAKLNWDIINAIRSGHLAKVKSSKLAKDLKVNITTIESVRYNKTWKNRSC